MGVQHVYLGNVNGEDATNTNCSKCGTLLVTRYGLNAVNLGLDNRGHCSKCSQDMHFKQFATPTNFNFVEKIDIDASMYDTRSFDWHGDIVSLHVQILNMEDNPVQVYHRRRFTNGTFGSWRKLTLQPKESYRFIIAKSREDEQGPEVVTPKTAHSNLHEVFDRAHFPTQSIEEVGISTSDITPMLKYAGKQNMYDILKKEKMKADEANN
jgi:pyruvate formate lyase activating enzyme